MHFRGLEKHAPKGLQKSSQEAHFGAMLGAKLVQNRTKMGIKFYLIFGSILETIFGPFWSQLGSKIDPQITSIR